MNAYRTWMVFLGECAGFRRCWTGRAARVLRRGVVTSALAGAMLQCGSDPGPGSESHFLRCTTTSECPIGQCVAGYCEKDGQRITEEHLSSDAPSGAGGAGGVLAMGGDSRAGAGAGAGASTGAGAGRGAGASGASGTRESGGGDGDQGGRTDAGPYAGERDAGSAGNLVVGTGGAGGQTGGGRDGGPGGDSGGTGTDAGRTAEASGAQDGGGADSPSDDAAPGDYPDGWLAWEAPGGDAGTGPAVVVSGQGWIDTWTRVQGFFDNPEQPPSNATGTISLSSAQANDLFSRLYAVDFAQLPHPQTGFRECYPRVYVRFCRGCTARQLRYDTPASLTPEMEAVWQWFDAVLGGTVSTNPRTYCGP